MDEPDVDRIMELLLAQWLGVLAPMFPGMACYVVTRGPEGEIVETTWADIDPDPAKQRKTLRHPMSLDTARKVVGLDAW